ncbi:YqhG family protein [Ureibacillus chungkukjangi]|uniref:YqhG family protein n=1 Tax=Ureibacillus chungkukjangi TaxID=1202712 RepID=UPI002041B150|nr:YqhG family protein [Ureibacillus chungkukjangi]MCM3390068.1 YqhG family protein [Ureibacillus chungkukjangi]
MYAEQVHDYLKTFFKETDCEIVSDEGHMLSVQLTIDMDKRIMNRPFYWQYIEATNSPANPARLNLITDRTKIQNQFLGEIIHFGSGRLHQIFKSTKELGSFVRMYQHGNEGSKMLTPYFCVNYKVSYYCDQTKEVLYSLGINLINGEIEDNFHEFVTKLALKPTIPEKSFCLQYIIKPKRAVERLDSMIQNIIQNDDHSWAEEAKKRWDKELEVLDYFYEGVEEKPESYEIEKKGLEERFNPHIKVEIINGGLFFLQ